MATVYVRAQHCAAKQRQLRVSFVYSSAETPRLYRPSLAVADGMSAGKEAGSGRNSTVVGVGLQQ